MTQRRRRFWRIWNDSRENRWVGDNFYVQMFFIEDFIQVFYFLYGRRNDWLMFMKAEAEQFLLRNRPMNVLLGRNNFWYIIHDYHNATMQKKKAFNTLSKFCRTLDFYKLAQWVGMKVYYLQVYRWFVMKQLCLLLRALKMCFPLRKLQRLLEWKLFSTWVHFFQKWNKGFCSFT